MKFGEQELTNLPRVQAAPNRIVTLTLNPCLDLNLEIEAFDFENPTRTISERKRAGGKGINVSVVLQILGAESTAVAAVGGYAGEEFLELGQEQSGLNLAAVKVKGTTRTNTVITARADGRHLKVNQKGAAVSEEELAGVVKVLDGLLGAGDVLIMAGSLPPGAPVDFYRRLVERYKKKECLVALDADLEAMQEGVKAGPHVIKPNVEELERLVGRRLGSEEEIVKGAREALGHGGQICLCSNGAKEAYLVTRTLCLKGTPVEAKGSAVGSGDACLAGLIKGMLDAHLLAGVDANEARGESGESFLMLFLEEKGLVEAFRLALACGSAAASTPDTEYFSREMLEGILGETMVERL